MSNNIIGRDVIIGKNFEIGNFCIIEDGVIIGDNVKIENYVYLMAGTKIGDNVRIDSYVRTGGNKNIIGNNCILKIRTTLSPGTVVEDDVFFGPHSMVLHATYNGRHTPTIIRKGVWIGSCALIGPGVVISHDVIIGSMSFVNKDCNMSGSLYVGIPARLS